MTEHRRANGRPGGLVMVADGIGGLDICGRWMTRVVRSAGLPLSVEVHHWGHGRGRWLADLTDEENHRLHSAAIARRVESFVARHPGAPVYLVGKSGGSGLVVWALERLPEATVERAILLSPALSPGYDLSDAIRALRRELVVFHSPLDLILLGAGTRLFGTVDRVRSVGAGLVGFQTPDGAPEETRRLYRDRLRQIRWTPSMVREAYLGGHFAVDWPPFLKRYVPPWLSPEPAATR